MKPNAETDRPILITGGTGQVGSALVALFSPTSRVIAPTRSELDLAHPDSIRSALRAFQPGLIINAGAYTAVDRAETEQDICHAINAEAPGVLAAEARDIDAALIHYSTDYVFDGSKSEPYTEDDPTGPLNTYGRTKLLGEQAVRALGGATIILRCSWVYSNHGSNFLRTMLRLREKPELSVVDDQFGAPTWADAIASSTFSVVSAARESSEGLASYVASHSGVYHLSASGRTTWKGFAEQIFQNAGGEAPRVKGITTEEYAAPARRPRNSMMNNRKIAAAFGVRMASWQEQLESCMASQ